MLFYSSAVAFQSWMIWLITLLYVKIKVLEMLYWTSFLSSQIISFLIFFLILKFVFTIYSFVLLYLLSSLSCKFCWMRSLISSCFIWCKVIFFNYFSVFMNFKLIISGTCSFFLHIALYVSFPLNLYPVTSSWQGRLLAKAGDYAAAANIFQKVLELWYASKSHDLLLTNALHIFWSCVALFFWLFCHLLLCITHTNLGILLSLAFSFFFPPFLLCPHSLPSNHLFSMLLLRIQQPHGKTFHDFLFQ